jgi:hypothetical protein
MQQHVVNQAVVNHPLVPLAEAQERAVKSPGAVLGDRSCGEWPPTRISPPPSTNTSAYLRRLGRWGEIDETLYDV